jgi:hypothetical protein
LLAAVNEQDIARAERMAFYMASIYGCDDAMIADVTKALGLPE